MRILVVTPPEPLVTYEQAVARLRLAGGEDERADVESMIAAATRTVDGPAGWLGRCLGPQVLEARFDDWNDNSLRLPYPPVVAVQSVSYIDGAGIEQVIDAAGYELLGQSLAPVFGASWPQARSQREAVRVRYGAGYDPANPVDALALAGTRTAILLMVGDLYRRRDTTVDGISTKVPMSIDVELLLPPRVYS